MLRETQTINIFKRSRNLDDDFLSISTKDIKLNRVAHCLNDKLLQSEIDTGSDTISIPTHHYGLLHFDLRTLLCSSFENGGSKTTINRNSRHYVNSIQTINSDGIVNNRKFDFISPYKTVLLDYFSNSGFNTTFEIHHDKKFMIENTEDVNFMGKDGFKYICPITGNFYKTSVPIEFFEFVGDEYLPRSLSKTNIDSYFGRIFNYYHQDIEFNYSYYRSSPEYPNPFKDYNIRCHLYSYDNLYSLYLSIKATRHVDRYTLDIETFFPNIDYRIDYRYKKFTIINVKPEYLGIINYDKIDMPSCQLFLFKSLELLDNLCMILHNQYVIDIHNRTTMIRADKPDISSFLINREGSSSSCGIDISLLSEMDKEKDLDEAKYKKTRSERKKKSKKEKKEIVETPIVVPVCEDKSNLPENYELKINPEDSLEVRAFKSKLIKALNDGPTYPIPSSNMRGDWYKDEIGEIHGYRPETVSRNKTKYIPIKPSIRFVPTGRVIDISKQDKSDFTCLLDEDCGFENDPEWNLDLDKTDEDFDLDPYFGAHWYRDIAGTNIGYVSTSDDFLMDMQSRIYTCKEYIPSRVKKV